MRDESPKKRAVAVRDRRASAPPRQFLSRSSSTPADTLQAWIEAIVRGGHRKPAMRPARKTALCARSDGLLPRVCPGGYVRAASYQNRRPDRARAPASALAARKGSRL